MKKLVTLIIFALLMIATVSAYNFATETRDYDTKDSIQTYTSLISENTAEPTVSVMQPVDDLAKFQNINADTLYYIVYGSNGYQSDVDYLFIDSQLSTCAGNNLDCTLSKTSNNNVYTTTCRPDVLKQTNRYCEVYKNGAPLTAFIYYPSKDYVARVNFLKKNAASQHMLFQTAAKDKEAGDYIEQISVLVNNTHPEEQYRREETRSGTVVSFYIATDYYYKVTHSATNYIPDTDNLFVDGDITNQNFCNSARCELDSKDQYGRNFHTSCSLNTNDQLFYCEVSLNNQLVSAYNLDRRTGAIRTVNFLDAIVPIPDNNIPVALTTGPYTGCVNQPITFDGSNSYDPDGNIVTYSWTFGDSSGSTKNVIVQHTYTQTGTFLVTLMVTDNDGYDNMTTTTATVYSCEESPVAEANGPYSGLVNLPVSFTSSGSYDPDGQIVSYLWDFGDGATSNLANPTHTYQEAGNYTIVLTVTDNDGLEGTDSTLARIQEGVTEPPVAEANGPYSGLVNIPVSFTSLGSYDPDGQIVSYFWDFGDGATSNLANPTHTYTSTGTYTAKLIVTDNNGAIGIDTAEVIIQSMYPPTAVILAPSTGSVLEEITFDGSGSSDPDGGTITIVSYLWDFGEPDYYGWFEEGENRIYTINGVEYQIEIVEINDNACQLNVNNIQTTILNEHSTTIGDLKVSLNEIIYSGNQRYCAMELTQLKTGSIVTHIYEESGEYTVTLTVTDNQGLTGTATHVITITNNAPYIITTAMPDAYVNQQYKFKFEAADPEGESIYFYLVNPINNKMTIDKESGLFRWVPSKKYLGDNEIEVCVADLEHDVCKTFTLTVIDPDEERDSEITLPRRRLLVKSLELDNEVVSPGDEFVLSISLENTDEHNSLKDVEVTAIIDELGLRNKIGPFRLKKDDVVSKNILFVIPADAKLGTYDIRITINGKEDDSLHRIKYRQITVK